MFTVCLYARFLLDFHIQYTYSLKCLKEQHQTAMLASLPPLKYRKQDRPTERNSNIISELDQKEEKGKQIKCFYCFIQYGFLWLWESLECLRKKNIHSTEKWSLQMLWQNLIITLCCPSFIWTITHEAVSLFVAITYKCFSLSSG